MFENRSRWPAHRLVGPVGAVLLGLGVAAIAGCAARPPLDQGYRALMSPAEQRRYDAMASPDARAAFVEERGLKQRFEDLSEADRRAVAEHTIIPGMDADALLMAWGEPYACHRVSERYEEWIYDGALSRHVRSGALYYVDVKDGKVAGWFEHELSDGAVDSGLL